MKLQALLYGIYNVTVVSFVNCYDACVKAVYVDTDGTVNCCNLDKIRIIDKDYIPKEVK